MLGSGIVDACSNSLELAPVLDEKLRICPYPVILVMKYVVYRQLNRLQ